MALRDRIRHVALLLLPPLVINCIRRLRRRPVDPMAAAPARVPAVDPPEPVAPAEVVAALPEWEIIADNAEVWTAHDGWTHDSILQTQLVKWPAFVRSVEGSRALGQSHEAGADAAADIATHNTLMSFGYVLGRAARPNSALSVLDWGGGLGHYYLYARSLFPDLALDYVIKDFANICEVGQPLLPEARFVSGESQALSRCYDLVFASSSLHYARDMYGLLARLCDSASQWLMITRTPIVENSDDFLVVQRPYMYGYLTEYPGWFINRQRLLQFVTARGFVLERQFLVAEEPNVPNAPERAHYYGFLFRRVAAEHPVP